MKLTVRCGLKFHGKNCREELLPPLDIPGFPDEWFNGGNYERLRDDQRFYNCPKHGAVQIHEEDLLRRVASPRKPVILATRVRRPGDA